MFIGAATIERGELRRTRIRADVAEPYPRRAGKGFSSAFGQGRRVFSRQDAKAPRLRAFAHQIPLAKTICGHPRNLRLPTPGIQRIRRFIQPRMAQIKIVEILRTNPKMDMS